MNRMTNFLNKTLTLLLVATTLAGWLMPPGVRHAHAGGEEAHSHHHDHEDDHRHGHHACESHGEHGVAERDVEAAGLVVAHIHFNFLGFGFSLPCPDSDEDDPTNQDRIATFGFVGLSKEVLLQRESARDIAIVFSIDLQCWFHREEALEALHRLVALRLDRSLLCDSARFERSGVLLI